MPRTTQANRLTSSIRLCRRELLRSASALAVFPTLAGLHGLFAVEPSRRQVENLALRFAKYYRPVKVQVTPQVPAYPLPLDLSTVANFQEAAGKLGLAAEEPSLKTNGFAVLPGQRNEDIVAPYKDLRQRGIPIFITADTLLHLYHVQFDETLKDIEEREFYKDLVALTETLVQELARSKPDADTETFRAARTKALTYLTIGLKALKPEAALPVGVDPNAVSVVLDKIRKHEGFWPNPDAAHEEWPLFRYAEDFSQYMPRGHYTRSEVLKKYFVGMMWFGRMTFLLKGDRRHGPGSQPALVSVAEAEQQTLAAAMLTRLLAETRLADGRTARAVWERIYVVTSFYVGLADDLGFPEYHKALAKASEVPFDLTVLQSRSGHRLFHGELARHAPPAIYSGTGAQETRDSEAGPDVLLKALHKSAGFRLMGQRFVPDSYMMGKLVYPTVGFSRRGGTFTSAGAIRGFPRGLDVMAVLGSTRARELLHELGDDAYAGNGQALSYDDALAALRKEYAGLNAQDWNRNLYWSWLYSLQPLLAEYGSGYPTFMTTTAYRTKSLNTALASWAQLRHDTILYVKQSYTATRASYVPPVKPVEGYVEPVPEFYARLLALTRMTNQGLSELNVLNAAAKRRLASFDKILERLLAIAEKELADKELSQDDYHFIRDFGEKLQAVVVPPERGKLESRSMKTTLIADVHTDQNTQQVLEEGTGYVDLGVFVYRQPDGRLVLGAGPVLSYHEFKQPMRDRLTDEKWSALLRDGKAPPQPEWTRTYRSLGREYVCQVK